MHIEIMAGSPIRTNTSKRTGKQFSKQQAWLHLYHEPYPRELQLFIESPAAAYAVGDYDLSPESFGTDQYDGIEVRPVLVPRKADK